MFQLLVVGGSLELPMWLTDGFLVTFFGRWWGAVRIHVIHVQLLYMVHRTRWTNLWWWGQYTHTCVPTATIHSVLYTVNSRVVVGAIYAYMCTYSYHTRWTHVWWWGQYMHTCVPTATVHGVPYTVNSRVVVGAIYAYMCTYSYRTRCTIHGVLTCGGGGNIRIHVYLQLLYTVHRTQCTVHGVPYMVHRTLCTVHCAPYMVSSRVEGAFMCGSYSRVQGTFTCGSYSRVRRATKVKFFTPWYLWYYCVRLYSKNTWLSTDLQITQIMINSLMRIKQYNSTSSSWASAGDHILQGVGTISWRPHPTGCGTIQLETHPKGCGNHTSGDHILQGIGTIQVETTSYRVWEPFS